MEHYFGLEFYRYKQKKGPGCQVTVCLFLESRAAEEPVFRIIQISNL